MFPILGSFVQFAHRFVGDKRLTVHWSIGGVFLVQWQI